jgi:3-dehydroquinate synthase
MGLGTAARLERIKAVLEKMGLPLAMPKGLSPEQLTGVMRRDKKAVGGWPRFVLLKDIGRVHSEGGQWAVSVPQEIIVKVLGRLCG